MQQTNPTPPADALDDRKPPGLVYPALADAADTESARAQHLFLLLNGLQLGVLALVAIISGWGPSDPAHQRALAWTVSGLMFAALGLAIALRIGKFDDRWFKSRAFAEGVKGAVWYFMMSPRGEADARQTEYRQRVRELQERLPEVWQEVVLVAPEEPSVTPQMRQLQQASVEEKAELYRRERLRDQLQWYASKSQQNKSRERGWFWLIFIVDFVAIAYSVLQALLLWQYNAVGGFAAVTSTLVAWIQIKRFSDLRLSYAIAAGDLNRINEEREHVSSEQELQQFTQEVETAVSREHSMWLAKRMI